MYEVKRALPVTVELPTPIYYHRDRPGSLSTEMNATTEIRRLKCNIREAQIVKRYYKKGDTLEEETTKRFYSFLRDALYRISLRPRKGAIPYMKELKSSGLYPYEQPQNCVLVKCPGVERNDILAKLLDVLYTNLNSQRSYCSMRLIQCLFRLKQMLLFPKNRE